MDLHRAARPVLVLGSGVQGCRSAARELVELLQIPVVWTWGACDLMPSSHPLNIGGFGTHGTRAANFCIQNADYLLCIGARLDTKSTGTPAASFARAAHIVMVDIDRAEIAKMEKCGVKVEGRHMDAGMYIGSLADAVREIGMTVKPNGWLEKCQDWKRRFPPVVPSIIKEVSGFCLEGDTIVSDTGCALAWMMQGFEFKEGQRFLHPFNNTPMGYGLPGAIGAHYATGKRVICVTGDGSIMMSIGELATISAKQLPIKTVLLNNDGHAMCRQSQREWLGASYPSTSISGGLSFPDFEGAARGMGKSGVMIETYSNLWEPRTAMRHMFAHARPAFLEVSIDPDADVIPKVKAGRPNEDAAPYLTREELQAEMLIPLWGMT